MVTDARRSDMDKNDLRRTRLRALINTQFGGVVLRLANRLDMKPPQLHRWLSGGQNMHEDSARTIEEKLGLESGWFDEESDVAQSSPVTLADKLLSPDDKATYVIDGMRALLALAGLPINCLGSSVALRRTLIEGTTPVGLAPDLVHRAVAELWRESAQSIRRIKDPDKVADLVLAKAQNWIEPTSSPANPALNPEYTPEEK
jgi:hypothetical protein